ncbi:hypothetical protein G7054_g8144 [Neopestalotiopsis clavispora]|nr:hypothetical protein G7054_g8144 [Neopestalotiopsis clavispora]
MSEEPRLEASLGNKATVFRVRGTFSRSDLPGVLHSCLGVDHNPSIKSFAPQADENVNVATVTFSTTPIQLLGSDQITFDDQNVTFDTHFRGLSVLFSPGAAQHHLDIIAVCGLGGHAFGSFKERSGTHMWLRDSLPQDFQNARVLIYGYDSHIPGSTSFQTLESLAASLRNHVDGIKPLSGPLNETPIIFIAHSLGGLVLKQQESELLRSQSRNFFETFVSREARIFCFYETKTSPTAEKGPDGGWRMNGEHVVLVGSASATHCRPWESEVRHVLGLNRDHSGLVKFRSGDEDYIKVRNVLGEIANNQYRLSRPKPMISEAEQKLTDQCLKAMGHTNPIDTMRRIESTKDDLVAECNEWIKSDPHVQEWKNNQNHRLLWLSGDPGKGKTMLMMSLVQEFRKFEGEHHILTFFFCQNTDSRLNTAHAVLCGLLWLLIRENPVLGCYLHEDYRHHKDFLDGPDAFAALCRIMTALLQDAALPTVYILIDALDECDEGRDELLKFIGDNATSAYSKAKWLVTSRNHLDIGRGFKMRQHDVLSLELNTTQITAAVEFYTKHKVDELAKRNNYNERIRERVERHLLDNAHSTFLWVALACKHLHDTAKRNISAELAKLPAGLSSLYDRMLNQLSQLRDEKDRVLIMAIIKFVTIAKRPLLTQELLPLLAQEISEDSDEPFEDLIDNNDLQDLIKSCGSFITVREGIIYLIHQSAKDYLISEKGATIYSPHMKEEHCTIVDHSLTVLSRELAKDMYSHDCPRHVLGSSLSRLKDLDYISCYWVDHLTEYQNSCGIDTTAEFTRHASKVHDFLVNYFLRWVELLCLLGQLKATPGLLWRLETAAKRYTSERLHSLAHDATRFLARSYLAIEKDPLQIYNFGVTFAPEESLIRKGFLNEVSTSIDIRLLAGSKKWTPLQHTFDGHEAPVWSIAFSPDSQQLASASHDRTVRLWDTLTGKSLWELQGHTKGIYSVSFSPDGQQLATASQDTTVQLWNVLSGNMLWTLRGHTNRVLGTAFSPDGARLASWSDDRTPRLWDTATGKLVRTFDGHTGPIRSLAFSLDGTSLVTGSKDKTIRIWKVATKEPSRVVYSHESPVYLETFSPWAQQIASASISQSPAIGLWNMSRNSRTIVLQSVETGEVLRILKGHTGPVSSIAFSPDSQYLASTSNDGMVRLWNAITGECIQILKGHERAPSTIAFSSNGLKLASGSMGDILIWDITDGTWESTRKIKRYIPCGNPIAFSPNCQQLASGFDSKTARLWDMATGQVLQTFESFDNHKDFLSFSPDGRKLAVQSGPQHIHGYLGWKSSVQFWDTLTGKPKELNFEHRDHGFLFHRITKSPIVFSPDGRLLASASSKNEACLHDTTTWNILKRLEGPKNSIASMAFDTDGHFLASGSNDQVIHVWNTITAEVSMKLKGHKGQVSLLAFSPDGQRLMSGSVRSIRTECSSIWLWNLKTGEAVWQIEGYPLPIRALAFSPDERQLASVSDDTMIRLWEVSTGELLQRFECHDDQVYSILFSPNGQQLVTRSHDSDVKLWDVATGDNMHTFERFTDLLRWVDEQQLTSWFDDQIVHLWDPAGGGALQTFLRRSAAKFWHPVMDSNDCAESGFFFDKDTKWLTFNGSQLIWLPYEFRPRVSAVYENRIAIGSQSGVAYILEADVKRLVTSRKIQ